MKSRFRFTGYHATAIITLFFCVVIAVNILMASYAVGTFGGTVVDNSYVASQKFNGWLREARAEAGLDWQISEPVREAGGHVVVWVQDRSGKPMQGAIIDALAQHPVGRAPDTPLSFDEIAPGQFRSTQPLLAGRWNMWVRVSHGERHVDKRFVIS